MELTDGMLRQVIVSCIVSKKYASKDILRELAKRPEIRNIWNVCKSTGSPLFKGYVTEWNALQMRLIFWLNYYSSIEGAYNKPPEWIIRNDEHIDTWMKNQVKESEQESEQNWRKGKVDMPRTPYDHDEVFEIQND
jgi:hypothetical protein